MAQLYLNNSKVLSEETEYSSLGMESSITVCCRVFKNVHCKKVKDPFRFLEPVDESMSV